jgi:tetratricopeptide (TPR) repeat protein
MSLALGSKETALVHANRAIRHDPTSAAAWALRGRCFRQLNQPDQALADLHHGLEFEPNNSEILLDVATVYRQRGMPERSLTAILRLMDSYPPGEEPQNALVLQGVTLLDLGRPQQACECLTLATQRGAPSADGMYYLAKAYMAAGDATKATATAQQALALNASHQPSRQLLTQLAALPEAEATQRR